MCILLPQICHRNKNIFYAGLSRELTNSKCQPYGRLEECFIVIKEQTEDSKLPFYYGPGTLKLLNKGRLVFFELPTLSLLPSKSEELSVYQFVFCPWTKRMALVFFFHLDLLMGYHACYLQQPLKRDNKKNAVMFYYWCVI